MAFGLDPNTITHTRQPEIRRQQFAVLPLIHKKFGDLVQLHNNMLHLLFFE
jgi:hypothetical protein